MMRTTVSTQPQIIIVVCCITLRRSAYGAWGSCVVYNSSDAAIGDLNPLRYRSYYYDAETGFYYLQSRYYDPAICRFINADTFATTDANGFLSANMRIARIIRSCERTKREMIGGCWQRNWPLEL